MKFKIDRPCPENWDEMREISGGKFCESCAKKVWDFNLLSNEKARVLVQKGSICGKITKSNLAIVGILLSISITTISCSSQKKESYKTEAKTDRVIKISGKISWAPNIELKLKEIKLVTRRKLYKGRMGDDNIFEIELPESELRDKNIIKIDYSKSFGKDLEEGFSLQMLSKSDVLSNKTIIADNGTKEIGAVVIVSPEPPDFYFLDGQRISERKFETVKKENPHFETVALENASMKSLVTDENCGTLYLMYSN